MSKDICEAFRNTVQNKMKPSKDGNRLIYRKADAKSVKSTQAIQKAFFEKVEHKDYDKLVEESKEMNNPDIETTVPQNTMNTYLRNI